MAPKMPPTKAPRDVATTQRPLGIRLAADNRSPVVPSLVAREDSARSRLVSSDTLVSHRSSIDSTRLAMTSITVMQWSRRALIVSMVGTGPGGSGECRLLTDTRMTQIPHMWQVWKGVLASRADPGSSASHCRRRGHDVGLWRRRRVQCGEECGAVASPTEFLVVDGRRESLPQEGPDGPARKRIRADGARPASTAVAVSDADTGWMCARCDAAELPQPPLQWAFLWRSEKPHGWRGPRQLPGGGTGRFRAAMSDWSSAQSSPSGAACDTALRMSWSTRR